MALTVLAINTRRKVLNIGKSGGKCLLWESALAKTRWLAAVSASAAPQHIRRQEFSGQSSESGGNACATSRFYESEGEGDHDGDNHETLSQAGPGWGPSQGNADDLRAYITAVTAWALFFHILTFTFLRWLDVASLAQEKSQWLLRV
jgi:hypothetical protein